MNHYALLTGGWIFLAAGLLALPIPVPLPVPIAGFSLVAGTAILISHSRQFRHGLQLARYRHRRFSRGVERIAAMAPARFRRLLKRTRPDLVMRHRRMRARATA